MTIEQTLNSLEEGDTVLLNNEYTVTFLGKEKERRMDPQAEEEVYTCWYFEDEKSRFYEMIDIHGIAFDRAGKNGSYQAPDSIIKQPVADVERCEQ